MARLCLALLRNISRCFKVADKSVRNFDAVSYYNRRNSNVSPVFVAGVGLERLTFTFPLNPPLIKGDLWQGLALHCCAIVYTRRTELHACNP